MKKLKVHGYDVAILDGNAIQVRFKTNFSKKEQLFISMKIWEYLESEGFVVEEKTH